MLSCYGNLSSWRRRLTQRLQQLEATTFARTEEENSIASAQGLGSSEGGRNYSSPSFGSWNDRDAAWAREKRGETPWPFPSLLSCNLSAGAPQAELCEAHWQGAMGKRAGKAKEESEDRRIQECRRCFVWLEECLWKALLSCLWLRHVLSG